MTDQPPFFIVGSGRSGTTLLRRLLDRHPQVCVPEETHFIPRMYRPFLRLQRRGDLGRAVEVFNRQPVILKWGLHLEPGDIEGLQGDRAFARAVDLLMQRKCGLDGKSFWGEKSPENIFHISLLSQLFPEARFIHICRDARDVAISVMPLSWGPNNAYACARWWTKAIGAWHAVRDRVGKRGFEVRYEDFVMDSEGQLRRVTEFLGLDYDSKMLDSYPMRSDRVGLWKNKFYMSPTERRTIEAVAGVTLRSLGYGLTSETPRLSSAVALLSLVDDGYKRLSNRLLRH